jgi:hypothetical protein
VCECWCSVPVDARQECLSQEPATQKVLQSLIWASGCWPQAPLCPDSTRVPCGHAGSMVRVSRSLRYCARDLTAPTSSQCDVRCATCSLSGQSITTLSILSGIAFGRALCVYTSIELVRVPRFLLPYHPRYVRFDVLPLSSRCSPPHHSTVTTRHPSTLRHINSLLSPTRRPYLSSLPSSCAVLACPPSRR